MHHDPSLKLLIDLLTRSQREKQENIGEGKERREGGKGENGARGESEGIMIHLSTEGLWDKAWCRRSHVT